MENKFQKLLFKWLNETATGSSPHLFLPISLFELVFPLVIRSFSGFSPTPLPSTVALAASSVSAATGLKEAIKTRPGTKMGNENKNKNENKNENETKRPRDLAFYYVTIECLQKSGNFKG